MSRKKSGWGLLFFYETLSATSFNPTSCETDEWCVPSQTLLIPEGALKENGPYCVLCRTPQCGLNGVFHLRWSFRPLLIEKINLPSFPGYVGSSTPIFLIVQGEAVHCQIAGSSTLRCSLDHSLSYSYLHFEFTKKESNPALKWHRNEAGWDTICLCCYIVWCVWILSWSLNILLRDADLGDNCKRLVFLL